jgi:hypothetical protein
VGTPVSRRSDSPAEPDVDDSDMIGCHVCGAQATCFGSYEDMGWEPACDSCCGHGNEDGRCFPLGELPAKYVAASTAAGELYDALRTMTDDVDPDKAPSGKLFRRMAAEGNAVLAKHAKAVRHG